jgi:hypothetical protein
MRILLAFALGCLLVLTGAPAHAHAGSYDMKYVDGSNLILLTFNTHQPVSGLDIEHNIRLYDLVGAPIPYDEVRVEVRTQDGKGGKDGVDGLESSLRKQASLPMLATNESKLSYSYPGPGPYALTTVFYSGGQEISRGTFAIDIGKGTGGQARLWLWWVAAAFLVGAAAGMLARRRGGQPAVLENASSSDVDDEDEADEAGEVAGSRDGQPVGAGRQ